MKKTIYDNQEFFEQYKQMARSQQGLQGAGEWHVLKKLLPDFRAKQVLDLGCGYGWHCRYAAENGAKKVIGVDLSEKMLQVAKENTPFTTIDYLHEDISLVDFQENQFDVVISSLAFHYVESFEPLVKKIKNYLKADGHFVFSVEHPVFTSIAEQDWIYDEDGNIKYFPINDYFYEGERLTNFLDSPVKKYHRTLTTYLETLLSNDFHIQHVAEPIPSENMLEQPGMKDELRRPMMLIISAVNKKR
ncbi:class I SAM-dependent methyltransferase [Enterococcus faecium]|nr:class I SAM-dependent methyltransferase [Enterococcus faecium]